MARNIGCQSMCRHLYSDSYYFQRNKNYIKIDGVYFTLSYLGFKRCKNCLFYCMTSDRLCACCKGKFGFVTNVNKLNTQTRRDRDGEYKPTSFEFEQLQRDIIELMESMEKRHERKKKRENRLCSWCGENTTMFSREGFGFWKKIDVDKFICYECDKLRKRQERRKDIKLESMLPMVT